MSKTKTDTMATGLGSSDDGSNSLTKEMKAIAAKTFNLGELLEDNGGHNPQTIPSSRTRNLERQHSHDNEGLMFPNMPAGKGRKYEPGGAMMRYRKRMKKLESLLTRMPSKAERKQYSWTSSEEMDWLKEKGREVTQMKRFVKLTPRNNAIDEETLNKALMKDDRREDESDKSVVDPNDYAIEHVVSPTNGLSKVEMESNRPAPAPSRPATAPSTSNRRAHTLHIQLPSYTHRSTESQVNVSTKRESSQKKGQKAVGKGNLATSRQRGKPGVDRSARKRVPYSLASVPIPGSAGVSISTSRQAKDGKSNGGNNSSGDDHDNGDGGDGDGNSSMAPILSRLKLSTRINPRFARNMKRFKEDYLYIIQQALQQKLEEEKFFALLEEYQQAQGEMLLQEVQGQQLALQQLEHQRQPVMQSESLSTPNAVSQLQQEQPQQQDQKQQQDGDQSKNENTPKNNCSGNNNDDNENGEPSVDSKSRNSEVATSVDETDKLLDQYKQEQQVSFDDDEIQRIPPLNLPLPSSKPEIRVTVPAIPVKSPLSSRVQKIKNSNHSDHNASPAATSIPNARATKKVFFESPNFVRSLTTARITNNLAPKDGDQSGKYGPQEDENVLVATYALPKRPPLTARTPKSTRRPDITSSIQTSMINYEEELELLNMEKNMHQREMHRSRSRPKLLPRTSPSTPRSFTARPHSAGPRTSARRVKEAMPKAPTANIVTIGVGGEKSSEGSIGNRSSDELETEQKYVPNLARSSAFNARYSSMSAQSAPASSRGRKMSAGRLSLEQHFANRQRHQEEIALATKAEVITSVFPPSPSVAGRFLVKKRRRRKIPQGLLDSIGNYGPRSSVSPRIQRNWQQQQQQQQQKRQQYQGPQENGSRGEARRNTGETMAQAFRVQKPGELQHESNRHPSRDDKDLVKSARRPGSSSSKRTRQTLKLKIPHLAISNDPIASPLLYYGDDSPAMHSTWNGKNNTSRTSRRTTAYSSRGSKSARKRSSGTALSTREKRKGPSEGMTFNKYSIVFDPEGGNEDGSQLVKADNRAPLPLGALSGAPISRR